MKVKKVIDVLDTNEQARVPITDEGSQILLDWWEPKPPKEIREMITYIGRSAGVLNINTGRHSYELRLLVNDGSLMIKDYIWQDYVAKELMQKKLDSGLLKWKVIIFTLGLVSTIISGVWEFFGSRDKN
jgi:hypothetical protein